MSPTSHQPCTSAAPMAAALAAMIALTSAIASRNLLFNCVYMSSSFITWAKCVWSSVSPPVGACGLLLAGLADGTCVDAELKDPAVPEGVGDMVCNQCGGGGASPPVRSPPCLPCGLRGGVCDFSPGLGSDVPEATAAGTATLAVHHSGLHSEQQFRHQPLTVTIGFATVHCFGLQNSCVRLVWHDGHSMELFSNCSASTAACTAKYLSGIITAFENHPAPSLSSHTWQQLRQCPSA